MSRFAHFNPEDHEAAMERMIDRADHDRKAARENGDPQPRAILDPSFLLDTVRAATRALYPEARIPETPMSIIRSTEQWEEILRELPPGEAAKRIFDDLVCYRGHTMVKGWDTEREGYRDDVDQLANALIGFCRATSKP